MAVIAFTKVRLPYGWLGNMSPHKIMSDYGCPARRAWRTAEHLFQAMRFEPDSPHVDEIFWKSSPMSAKMYAKKHAQAALRTIPRSMGDEANMLAILRLKVEQHPDLAEQLLATGNATLVENVSARPQGPSADFWGMRLNDNGEWVGQNTLGKLWAIVRAELRAKSQTKPA